MKKVKKPVKDVRWDFSNVYKSMGSKEFLNDWKTLENMLSGAEKFFAENGIKKTEKPVKAGPKLADIVSHAIEIFNAAYILFGTLNAFINSYYSTDSYDKFAAQKMSELEKLSVKLSNLDTAFCGFIGSIGKDLQKMIKLDKILLAHEFVLNETYDESRYMMSEAEERLASELSLSGGRAFSKLQGVVSSQLKAPVTIKGETVVMPIAKVRNLAYEAGEAVRKSGYEAELAAWESVREVMAASMNGVKGHTITLNVKRNREDALHSAIDMNRLDRKTLETMMNAIKGSFPMFRKYFKKKAARLGQRSLAWWNLFAPAGKMEKRYSYDEACELIVENFRTFSDELGDFARNAFKKNWIDVYPRDGKRGGAFCTNVPKVEESRILCNFDGSFEQVLTIAHELGHAYHNECLKGLAPMQKSTPMALAETASIFCETIIINAALERASKEEKLAILETQLMGESQVIVDIYSRFLFEKEVFERREKSELSADELCEIMLKAQNETYGDGLDKKYLHKYMWALKPHYYSTGRAFYNFPYAFGQLFAIGLYKIFKTEGAKFVPKYKQLLRSTGLNRAAELTAKFGIDIQKPKFWKDSLKIIEAQVGQYLKL